jgi:hypothetical protein
MAVQPPHRTLVVRPRSPDPKHDVRGPLSISAIKGSNVLKSGLVAVSDHDDLAARPRDPLGGRFRSHAVACGYPSAFALCDSARANYPGGL